MQTRVLSHTRSAEGAEDLDKIHVISWYEQVVDCGSEPLLLLREAAKASMTS